MNFDDENKREENKDERSHLLIMEMTTTGILSTSSPLNQVELCVRRNLMQNPNPSLLRGFKRAPWKETVDDEEETGNTVEANIGEPSAHPSLAGGKL